MSDTAYKSLSDVYRHLVDLHYKLALSTLYNHSKAGKIRPDKNGLYTDQVIADYITIASLEKRNDPAGVSKQVASEKAAAETRLKQAQADRLEHTLAVERGQYVLASEFEEALAARAQVLRTDLGNLATGLAPEMVALVGGDPTRVPDLTLFLQAQYADLLARYAQEPEEET